MWYTLLRYVVNFFFFFGKLFEKFIDLKTKWNLLFVLIFSCIFMEANYSFHGENRLDFFLSLAAVWFPLRVLLVTEFILEKSLPFFFFSCYFLFCSFLYLLCSTFAFNCLSNFMSIFFFFFWAYFYLAALLYCTFMFSLIIFFIQHFHLLHRFLGKIKRGSFRFFRFFVKIFLCFFLFFYIVFIFIKISVIRFMRP